MWDEIARYLPEFPSGVLTAFDGDGMPCSQRVQPQPDSAGQFLRFAVSPGLSIQSGKACLLCHRHDEKLWNLKSFVIQGTLEQDGAGWLLRPERFIAGMGIGGMRIYLRFVSDGRKNTTQYLKKRGMPRPQVDWQMVMDLMAPEKEH